VHRYFVAAKRLEFALGGATTQLRRIGAVLARETVTVEDLDRVGRLASDLAKPDVVRQAWS
jgi:hypothetical protein